MEKERLLIFDLKSLTNQINRYIEHHKMHQENGQLTGAQHAVLGFISRNHEKHDIFQRDIEQEFQIRRSTATGILQNLEKGGYITRETTGYDARLKRIRLTPKAIRLDQSIVNDLKRLDHEITSILSPDETEQLFALLDKLNDNLNSDRRQQL